MDEEGLVYEEWFGRSVINSCIKMSYDIAQDMVDIPERDWKVHELPTVFNKAPVSDISWAVNKMMQIARNMRKRRFDSGALKIEKLKLSFVLDADTGLPSGFNAYSYKESNFLVEELMLLANQAVSHKIYESYPELAFLRNVS